MLNYKRVHNVAGESTHVMGMAKSMPEPLIPPYGPQK
jgi:hypothetical protein